MSSGELIPPKSRVLFKQSAYKEFKKLDGSVKRLVAAQLLKTEQNPLAGEPLGSKHGIDLRGLRKIYVDDKRMRIVWEVQADRVVVIVFGIGPREKGEIYRSVAERFEEGIVTLLGRSFENR